MHKQRQTAVAHLAGWDESPDSFGYALYAPAGTL
jgi:hypothetical protein